MLRYHCTHSPSRPHSFPINQTLRALDMRPFTVLIISHSTLVTSNIVPEKCFSQFSLGVAVLDGMRLQQWLRAFNTLGRVSQERSLAAAPNWLSQGCRNLKKPALYNGKRQWLHHLNEIHRKQCSPSPTHELLWRCNTTIKLKSHKPFIPNLIKPFKRRNLLYKFVFQMKKTNYQW